MRHSTTLLHTLHISESIWPPPFSTRVCRNEEPSPEGQRDKEISLSQFISYLFEGVGQLLPGDFAGLLMSRPRLLAAGDSCCQKVPQRFSGSIQGAWESAPVFAECCHYLNGLIQVKEEGWERFSKGWQGCSEGFPEGKA